MFRISGFETFVVEIKSAKSTAKIAGHIDRSLNNKNELFLSYVNQLGLACVLAYDKFKNDLDDKCFYVNTEFVLQLSKQQTQSFLDCNYLSIDQLGYSLPTNHHMIRLLQNDLAIGVDVAAQQFRNDDVIAEITIAASSENLFHLLSSRHQCQSSWKLNSPFLTEFENSCFDNQNFRKLLKIGKEVEYKKVQDSKIEIHHAIPLKKSEKYHQSTACIIL